MEKYSAYRDPGTGIQPFLTPVSPLGSDLLAKLTLPFSYLIGVVRSVLVLALLLVYLVFVRGVCLVFVPISPLYRITTHLFTWIIARLVLLLVGLLWIPVESVTRKRGRGLKSTQPWDPQAGDVIVSNWVSWVELLWLASKFNPIFVLPVSTPAVHLPTAVPSSPVTHTPGRRTGTGSANILSSTRDPSIRRPITGFRKVSLLSMIRLTGEVPPFGPSTSESQSNSLEEIRKSADRPVVVFPECTTSNGRGILRFADVFRHEKIPVKKYNVFVMCVRYDPPTSLNPTLAHSIPAPLFNPLPHIFTLTTSLIPSTVSIRLLGPSESPSSQLFMVNEVVTGSPEDQLAEACATLIAQIGKIKRTGMGWEDKSAFLHFYREKKN